MDRSYSQGLFFEDFQPGMNFCSVGRTITEHDVMTFAGLSGDFNQIHTDHEFSKSTPFGKRVAHGVLGLAVATGLAMRTGILEGTVLAFREIDQWKFTKPIFIGDTIHVLLEVKQLKDFPRLGGGMVTIDVDVQNQNDETVMHGLWLTLIKSKHS